MKKTSISIFLSLFFLSACGLEFIEKDAPPPNPAGPEIANILIELIGQQESEQIRDDDFDSTSLRDLITLGTPDGIRLRLRFEPQVL